MSQGPEGPRPVSPFAKHVELTGMLFPWDGVQPVLASMPGSPSFYLALFSDEERLRSFMEEAKIPFRSIKQVQDGPEFLTSFDERHRQTLKIIINPYYLPNGRVRFTEMFWD